MPARQMPRYETGLRQIADDAYAYLQWNGGWGISNAGFIETSDGLLVVDALLSPSMASGFVDAIREVSTAPFRNLVLTHAHLDHVGGNRAFEGAEIVAHANCHADLEAAALRGPERRPWMPDEWWDELREVRPLLPSRTFEDALELDLGGSTPGSTPGNTPGNTAQLGHWGPAHTTGDAFVYLPQSRVLFAGDLAFFYATPLCRGDMANWVRILDRIETDLEVDLIIPGHGPPGGRSEIDDQREYLAFLLARTRSCFDDGLSEEQAIETIDLGQWGRWPESERKAMNIAQLYRTFEQQRAVED